MEILIKKKSKCHKNFDKEEDNLLYMQNLVLRPYVTDADFFNNNDY